jgi:Fic family protein
MKKTEDRFKKRIPLSQEIIQKIAQIDELKGLWRGGVKLNPQILDRLRASVIITSTGASTRIEGAKMSDEDVARLLRGLKSRPPKGRDAEEVAGYADLLGRIFDNHETLRLSEGTVFQFHDILLSFSEKDRLHKGKYKTSDNIVVARDEEGKEFILFRPTPPYLVKKEMDDVLYWANGELENKQLHPLLVIANFIFEFLAIHPFIDGNGRLSRALTNLLLLKSGYAYVPYVSLEEIIEKDRVEYYLALRKTQKHHKTKHEDISEWVTFLLNTLVKQAELAKSLLGGAQPEQHLSPKQIQVYALFGGDEMLGVKEIFARLGEKMPKPTIKQALSRLVEEKLLERAGQGRTTRYRRVG